MVGGSSGTWLVRQCGVASSGMRVVKKDCEVAVCGSVRPRLSLGIKESIIAHGCPPAQGVHLLEFRQG